MSESSEPRRHASESVLVVSSRWTFWMWRTVGAAGFAAVSGVSLRSGGSFTTALGAVGVLMFGAFTVYGLRQWLRRGPRLRLSRDGVDAADLGVGEIPWADIERIESFGSAEAHFIAFHVPATDEYLHRMPLRARSIVRLLAASGLPTFSINLIGVDRDRFEIERRAVELWNRNRRAQRARR